MECEGSVLRGPVYAYSYCALLDVCVPLWGTYVVRLLGIPNCRALVLLTVLGDLARRGRGQGGV